MDDLDKEPDMLALEAALDHLKEHGFEAVQIMATKLDDEITSTMSRGFGNWNTRKGLAYGFVKKFEVEDAMDWSEDGRNS